MLDRSLQAKQHYSDAFSVLETLVYFPGQWRAYSDKSDTYAVQADNADRRHSLAQLVRRSRYFLRSIHALWRVVRLFVFAWNRRQRYKPAFPNYPAHVREFVYPWLSPLPNGLVYCSKVESDRS